MSYIIDEVDIQNLLEARQKFEEFRKDIITIQHKYGAIHAFNFTFELTWKTMKKLLDFRGASSDTIGGLRDYFREAAALGMLSDPKIWFGFIELRNKATHSHDEEVINQIIEELPVFSEALTDFLMRIGYK